MLPLNLYARVRVLLCTLHTRPRVQRAPGLPCALCCRGGTNEMQTSGALRREIVDSYLRSEMPPPTLSSCPGLSRASTSYLPWWNVDGREKTGQAETSVMKAI